MNYRSLQPGLMRSLLVTGLLGIGLVAGTAGQSRASEMEFKPSFAVSEEVNDNIYQTSYSKQADYITHITPAATFHYLAPFWNWDASYTLDYREYALHSHGNDFNFDGDTKGKITLVDNFFFIEATDSFHRVTLDVAHDATTESTLFLNLTEQNIGNVSPYLLWRLGDKSTLKTGYRYTDIRYFDSIGINEQDHCGFADFTYEWTPKLSLTSGYAFTRSETSILQYSKNDVYVGFKYQYADKSSLFGQIGESWQYFDGAGKVSYPFWDAGVTHDFDFATVTLDTNVQITPNPLATSTKVTSYTGKLDKTLKRGALGLSIAYAVYADTQTEVDTQRKLSFSGTGRYEVIPDLTASLSATAERYYINVTSGYPYSLPPVAWSLP
jgi:hypothetical protein